jgi:hypothetical protein
VEIMKRKYSGDSGAEEAAWTYPCARSFSAAFGAK